MSEQVETSRVEIIWVKVQRESEHPRVKTSTNNSCLFTSSWLVIINFCIAQNCELLGHFVICDK